MKKLIKDLAGRELNYAVGLAEGWVLRPDKISGWEDWMEHTDSTGIRRRRLWELDYSYGWDLAGPLIERERICLVPDHYEVEWQAMSDCRGCFGYGPTALIAAMRCFAINRLGTEIDVPTCISVTGTGTTN